MHHSVLSNAVLSGTNEIENGLLNTMTFFQVYLTLIVHEFIMHRHHENASGLRATTLSSLFLNYISASMNSTACNYGTIFIYTPMLFSVNLLNCNFLYILCIIRKTLWCNHIIRLIPIANSY